MQIDALGAADVRTNKELIRLVGAAVEGRSGRVGSGRRDGAALRQWAGRRRLWVGRRCRCGGGFFEMSPAGAEQVTLQIRSMMERAWEHIAIAYQGRAHIALGYATWDEYVDDRLSDLWLTVPREQRGAVVRSLSKAQMSLRAIAKVLGVDVATVHRALGARDPEEADDAGSRR